MKTRKMLSLNTRLIAIALSAFIPMFLVLVCALMSLSGTTNTYTKIIQSITNANQTRDFKQRMDYSMYLAVIGQKNFEELGNGEITVNGIATVDPYDYIDELEQKCKELSEMATVDVNRNQVTRLHSTLESLKRNIQTLEKMINGEGSYEENMEYLDENIYMLTSLFQDGIMEYIRVETSNLREVGLELEQKNQKLYWLCFITALIAIAVSGALTAIALKSVIVPIRKLCTLTEKVAEGDFTVRSKIENTNEIAILSQSFNDMTGEIGTLVENIKEKEQNIHLMETQLLQAQINPHFLYNTLDTIVWLAEDKRNEEVVSMVSSLSDFFRTTLCQGRDYITVQEEESHIESYLKIQQFRYQDIMDYEIHIEDSMKEYIIPKLMLQPLVENALYHGVKQKRGKSLIQVIGKEEAGRLIFKVIDNGKGMSKEELEKLRKNIESKSKDEITGGFGLFNTNQRIRHYYGDGYGLYIDSEEGAGTEVRILIAAKNIEPFS